MTCFNGVCCQHNCIASWNWKPSSLTCMASLILLILVIQEHRRPWRTWQFLGSLRLIYCILWSTFTFILQVNKLPLNLLDIILEKSILHCILNFSSNQRDLDAITSLSSVDLYWFQQITRHSMKRKIWKRLKGTFRFSLILLSTIILHINIITNSSKPFNHFTFEQLYCDCNCSLS